MAISNKSTLHIYKFVGRNTDPNCPTLILFVELTDNTLSFYMPRTMLPNGQLTRSPQSWKTTSRAKDKQASLSQFTNFHIFHYLLGYFHSTWNSLYKLTKHQLFTAVSISGIMQILSSKHYNTRWLIVINNQSIQTIP